MSNRPPSPPPQVVREKLAGYPPGTAESLIAFLDSADPAALRQAVAHIVQFHVPVVAGSEKPDVSGLPATTRLQEDLRLDSLTFAEMAFLLEDLAGRSLPEDALQRLRTLGDLEECVRTFLSPRANA